MSSQTSSDPRQLNDTTCLECRICWYLYDPAAGDPEQQIAAGTPFLQLPGYWRCPQCDSAPQMFIPVDEEIT
tara:strand:- start:565 stop:780 length:216 start_codon:yes stop_codon:yes gene_type:complete